MAELPENNVPQEIIESTCYSDDINNLERLRAGYVDEDDNMEGAIDVDFCVAGMVVRGFFKVFFAEINHF